MNVLFKPLFSPTLNLPLSRMQEVEQMSVPDVDIIGSNSTLAGIQSSRRAFYCGERCLERRRDNLASHLTWLRAVREPAAELGSIAGPPAHVERRFGGPAKRARNHLRDNSAQSGLAACAPNPSPTSERARRAYR